MKARVIQLRKHVEHVISVAYLSIIDYSIRCKVEDLKTNPEKKKKSKRILHSSFPVFTIEFFFFFFFFCFDGSCWSLVSIKIIVIWIERWFHDLIWPWNGPWNMNFFFFVCRSFRFFVLLNSQFWFRWFADVRACARDLRNLIGFWFYRLPRTKWSWISRGIFKASKHTFLCFSALFGFIFFFCRRFCEINKN